MKKKRTTNRRRAAAAVELALVLPFLVFLFGAAVDAGRVFYFTQIIENCARNGALYLSDPNAPAYNAYTSVTNAALSDATGLSPQPTVSSGNGTDSTGNPYVTCTVTWTFTTITGFSNLINNGQITRTVQMRKAP